MRITSLPARVIARCTLALASAGMASASMASGGLATPASAAPDNGAVAAAASRDLALAGQAPERAPGNAWWAGFGDPVLDQIEALAQARNLDLAMTAQTVMAARGALRVAGAKGLPSVGAAASYNREQASEQGILSLLGAQSPSTASAGGGDPFGSTAATGTGGPAFDLYQVGVDASWEIDLWGKARATRRAARADTLGAAYGHDAAAIALGADVARTYLRLRGIERDIAITREGIAVVTHGLAIAHRRETEGAVSHMDAAQAQADLESYRARLPGMEQERQALANALALLTGQMPHALDTLLAQGTDQTAAEPVWQAPIPAALPTDVARQRPDIAAAEAALHAATARVAAAKAEFYPSLSLTGSAGFQAVAFSNLADWSARQFIVGPAIHLPFFSGGAIRGHLELTRAQERRAALAYRQTVLKAWGEVDDALAQARARQLALAALERAVAASQDAARVATNRYRQGASSYVDVLLAQRSLLGNQLQLAQGRTQAALAVAGLHAALGGGWQAPSPAAAPTVAAKAAP